MVAWLIVVSCELAYSESSDLILSSSATRKRTTTPKTSTRSKRHSHRAALPRCGPEERDNLLWASRNPRRVLGAIRQICGPTWGGWGPPGNILAVLKQKKMTALYLRIKEMGPHLSRLLGSLAGKLISRLEARYETLAFCP